MGVVATHLDVATFVIAAIAMSVCPAELEPAKAIAIIPMASIEPRIAFVSSYLLNSRCSFGDIFCSPRELRFAMTLPPQTRTKHERSSDEMGANQSSEKTNDMSLTFCTGRPLWCIWRTFILELVTPLASASAVGAEKKNSFTPNPIRIAAATAIV